MIKKTVLLTSTFLATAMSYAHAQTNNGQSVTSYQPYYAQPTQFSSSAMVPQAHTTTDPTYQQQPTNNVTSSAAPQYATTSGAYSPISDRIISDPLYLPLKGQIYGATAYTFQFQPSSTYTYAGVKRSSTTAHDNDLSENILFGVTDEFSLHMSEGYQINSSHATANTTGISTTTNTNGFIDPTVGATWRVVDQARQLPIDVDLTLNYSPDMINARSADSTHDGSVAEGRQSGSFEMLVGREMKSFTFVGSGTVNYLGQRNYQSSDSGNMYSQPKGFSYNLSLGTQTRFTERWSLNVGAGYNFLNGEGTTDNTTGTYFKVKSASNFDFATTLNYHIIPNRLVAGLTFDYVDYVDGGNNYPTVTSDTEIKYHYANVFGGRLQYLFN